MPEKRPILIPATEGAAFVVRRGETIKVIDVEGHQIGDFICFNLHQSWEKLSTGETVNFNSLAGNGSIHLTVGSKLYSNLQTRCLKLSRIWPKGCMICCLPRAAALCTQHIWEILPIGIVATT